MNSMKRILFTVLAASLMVPSTSFADGWRRWHHPRSVVVVRHHDHFAGAAIAAGVLGGLATGIILDRVLTPPPAYYPPPPPSAPRDPYDAGYSDGYSRGIERGRYERYEDGRRRGYQEGYEDARAGRAY